MRAALLQRRGAAESRRISHGAVSGVSLVGTIGKAFSANGTSHTATLGQAATANNVLVAVIGGSAGALRSPPASPPTGWTEILAGRQLNGASAGMCWIYAKVAAGGETGMAITWSGNMIPGSRGFEFSGCDISSGLTSAIPQTIPYVFSNNASEILGDGVFVDALVTATHAKDYVLSILAGRGTNPLGAHAFAAGYTESDTAATGGVGVVQSAFKELTNSGDTTTPDASFTNSQGNPVMILGGIVLRAA
jgi:hypothetical protein